MPVANRKTIIYIENVEGALYPQDNLYPSDDLHPNQGTVIIGELTGNNFTGISSGSLKLDEILMDNSLTFGRCCSNKFEVQLYNVKLDFAKKPITVVQRVGDTEVPVFKGIVDSSEKDDSGFYRNITAYDIYYFKKDTDVASWWNNLWKENSEAKYTIKYLREGLLMYVGIPYISKNLVNDEELIGNEHLFDTITLDTLLGYLCDFSFCVPNINRSGIMDFITLKTTEPIEITGQYENGSNTVFEDYSTNKITGIQLYQDANNLVHLFGTEYNAYAIEANIFMLDMDENRLNQILGNIFEYIKNIQYMPCTVHMLESKWLLTLGDYIKTDSGTHYIMENNYSGSLLVEQEIKSVANGVNLSNKPSSSRSYTAYTGKVSKIEKTVDRLSVEFSNELDKVKTSVEQNANSIKIEAERASGEEQNIKASLEVKVDKEDVVSTINASADIIELEAGRLLIKSGNFILDEDGNAIIKSGKFYTGNRTSLSENVEGLYIGNDGLDFCWKKLNSWTDLTDWFHFTLGSSNGIEMKVNGTTVFNISGDTRVSGGTVGPHINVTNLIYSGILDQYST